jgi:hypothetical protein
MLTSTAAQYVTNALQQSGMYMGGQIHAARFMRYNSTGSAVYAIWFYNDDTDEMESANVYVAADGTADF